MKCCSKYTESPGSFVASNLVPNTPQHTSHSSTAWWLPAPTVSPAFVNRTVWRRVSFLEITLPTVFRKNKGKCKFHPRTGLQAQRRSRGIAYSFFNLYARWGETRYRWVGPRAALDGCRKSRPQWDSIPRTVKHLASRYTDWAIPAHIFRQKKNPKYGNPLTSFQNLW